jgi:hypothetical protein
MLLDRLLNGGGTLVDTVTVKLTFEATYGVGAEVRVPLWKNTAGYRMAGAAGDVAGVGVGVFVGKNKQGDIRIEVQAEQLSSEITMKTRGVAKGGSGPALWGRKVTSLFRKRPKVTVRA